jgi:hypothetical protein
MKIAELEELIQRSLADFLNDRLSGYRPRVSFTDHSGRPKEPEESEEAWSPESDEIRITFEACPETVETEPAEFHPVAIRGEALSATVLQERR